MTVLKKTKKNQAVLGFCSLKGLLGVGPACAVLICRGSSCAATPAVPVAATCGRVVLDGRVSLATGDIGVVEVTPAAEGASLLVAPPEADLPAGSPPGRAHCPPPCPCPWARRCCVIPGAACGRSGNRSQVYRHARSLCQRNALIPSRRP